MARRELLLCLLLAAVLPGAAAGEAIGYDVSVGADHRLAQLDWNIAGDLTGSNPNVLSELRWYDLDIAQISVALRAEAGRVIVELAGDYGDITSGNNEDSDYLADNRQHQFSRSVNTGAGTVADARLGVGYRFALHDDALHHYGDIIPMFGVSLHRQDLRIRDGVQVLPSGGAIDGLDSRYGARWRGPWIGVTLQVPATARALLSADFAYHWASYSAEADWNLRDDLAHPLSFRHDSIGSGLAAGFALSYQWTRRWSLMGRLEAQQWRADPGIDTYYLVDPDTGETLAQATRLNAVHWKSRTVGVSVVYRF